MVRLTIPNDLFAQITSAANVHQPELRISSSEDIIMLEGPFVVSGPKGPFDYYQVKLGVPIDFPWNEAIVLETGGRIPKIADRHIFPKEGNCCLGVWEEWLLTAPDHSFETFMTGWLHDYFFSQTWFEAKGEWPYGERSHGKAGVIESYADLLGVHLDTRIIADHLKLLTRAKIKGHALCPCGSGLGLRKCHMDSIQKTQQKN